MKKEKKITIPIPSEDIEYVESIRIYNVKIPVSVILKYLSDYLDGKNKKLK